MTGRSGGRCGREEGQGRGRGLRTRGAGGMSRGAAEPGAARPARVNRPPAATDTWVRAPVSAVAPRLRQPLRGAIFKSLLCGSQ